MGSIHIKLEHPEVIDLKRDILLLEKGLLETLLRAKNYTAFRKKEFMIKNDLKKRFDEVAVLITELENMMPKEELHELLQGKTPKEVVKKEAKEHKKKAKIEDKKKREIEDQIAEIRAKLAILK